MNTSDTSTVIKLLFLSFRLTLATIHPNAQDKVSTNRDSSARNVMVIFWIKSR